MLAPDSNGLNPDRLKDLRHMIDSGAAPPTGVAIKWDSSTIEHWGWSGFSNLCRGLNSNAYHTLFDMKKKGEDRSLRESLEGLTQAFPHDLFPNVYINIWASAVPILGENLKKLADEFPHVRILVIIADSFTCRYDIDEWVLRANLEVIKKLGCHGIILPAAMKERWDEDRSSLWKTARRLELGLTFTGISRGGIHKNPVSFEEAARFGPDFIVAGSEVFLHNEGPLEGLGAALREIEMGYSYCKLPH